MSRIASDAVALAADSVPPEMPGTWGRGPLRFVDSQDMTRRVREWFKFDPARPVSALGARLLRASNALHSHATDGTPFAPVGESRWATWWQFVQDTKGKW